jgi:hypothetical protein
MDRFDPIPASLFIVSEEALPDESAPKLVRRFPVTSPIAVPTMRIYSPHHWLCKMPHTATL